MTDCTFDIALVAQKKGTFLAGLSIGGKAGPVDLPIGYEGEFNGDVTSHSGNFKIVTAARRPCGARACSGRCASAAARSAARASGSRAAGSAAASTPCADAGR